MPTTDKDELVRLIRADHPCISVVTYEEEHALAVAREAGQEAGRDVLVWDCVNGLCDGVLADAIPYADTQPPAGALAFVDRRLTGGGPHMPSGPALFVFLDLAEHLGKDPAVRRVFRNVTRDLHDRQGTLLLIDAEEPPALVRASATNIEIGYPDEEELEGIVRDTVRHQHRKSPLTVELTRNQLQQMIRHLRGLTRRQAREAVMESVAHDRKLSADDLVTILRHKKRTLSAGGLLQYVEAPTSLDEVGGLDNMKRWLAARQNALSDAARDFGIDPPRGVLMLGVQGAGKSLASKAVATAWERPLLMLDAGMLYDRFIGESERRLRDAMRQAEMMAPCILWIDEIEKAFASAGAQSNDGGLSKRMFGSLLTWMQEHRAPVFLIATANDVAALPPELLRKGRFDEIFFVDLPGPEARKRIFEIHLARRKRDPGNFELDTLVAASEGYSGAEIEQGILSALHEAFTAGTDVTTADIERVLRSSPPLSVTRREQIEQLRHWARDRCVPAD